MHNQRIERFWRDVFKGCISLFYDLFYQMEEGMLDPSNENDLFALHDVFVPQVNLQLRSFMAIIACVVPEIEVHYKSGQVEWLADQEIVLRFKGSWRSPWYISCGVFVAVLSRVFIAITWFLGIVLHFHLPRVPYRTLKQIVYECID